MFIGMKVNIRQDKANFGNRYICTIKILKQNLKKKNIKRIQRTALPAQQKQTQQVYDGADIFIRLEDAAG